MRWRQLLTTWWGTQIAGSFAMLIVAIAAGMWPVVGLAAASLLYALIVVAVKRRRGSRIS